MFQIKTFDSVYKIYICHEIILPKIMCILQLKKLPKIGLSPQYYNLKKWFLRFKTLMPVALCVAALNSPWFFFWRFKALRRDVISLQMCFE